jgi:hypothetical protein
MKYVYAASAWIGAALACGTSTVVMATPPAASSDGDELAVRAGEEAIAKQFISGERYPGDVRDVTTVYGWVSVGRVYWVADVPHKRTSVVVRLTEQSNPASLNGDTAAISSFLSRQFNGRPPAGAQFNAIVKFLKDVATSPGAAIATKKFCDRQRPGIQHWLKGRAKDPATFEQCCTGIQLDVREDKWTVQFNVFNTRGGVNSVSASGSTTPLTVDSIRVDSVKPDGEFYYPLEG